ncbi:MAG: hypothetical protein J3K34DRAFT_482373, partial [Monoraphidium minutum]
ITAATKQARAGNTALPTGGGRCDRRPAPFKQIGSWAHPRGTQARSAPVQRADQRLRQRLRRRAELDAAGRQHHAVLHDQARAGRGGGGQAAAPRELEPAPHRPAGRGVVAVEGGAGVDADFVPGARVVGVESLARRDELVNRRLQARHVILVCQLSHARGALPHLGLGHLLKHHPQRQPPVGAAVARQRHAQRRRRARAAAGRRGGGGRGGGHHVAQHGGREREHLAAGGQSPAVVKHEGGGVAGVARRRGSARRRARGACGREGGGARLAPRSH